MGRGSSKVGGGGGAAQKTPSGMTIDDLMNMPESQRYDTMADILDNPNITVPNYLDNSDTSKLLYALGMDNKPTVVDDATLDGMPGREIFRTVYEKGMTMPPPSSEDVLDQIRNGDYTQLSGDGSSLHGRALYFATDYHDSAVYGHGWKNPAMMRAKINPNATIRSEGSLVNQMSSDTAWRRSKIRQGGMFTNRGTDEIALYAISHGIDGWYSNTYTMMVNRGALTASKRTKSVNSANGGYARTWSSAKTISD